MDKNNSSARQNTLMKIRNALKVKTPSPFPVPKPGSFFGDSSENELISRFSDAFTGLLGKLVICSDQQAANIHLRNLALSKKWDSVHYSFREGDPHMQLNELPFVNDNDIHTAQAAISGCECLVARTGTIVLSAAQACGRIIPVYTPVHIVMAFSSQVVGDVKDAINFMKMKYGDNLPSSVSFASGPSRTGDIEKTLVVGVHGPREVYVFLIDA